VCRHTYNTNTAKHQILVETLEYLMGHTNISVTSNMYTSLKLENARKEMEKLKTEAELKMVDVVVKSNAQ